ncbi:Alkyl hydroperoxide reductase subunit C [Nitrospira sp. KM1]|uniref:peroxiredoxin n=1 Tax=Nitrospira sp. KM1 TaxID=1936990 RepID=UPI0013A74D0F|nr:redoxin domain-containing protein [Nitrospira sp. KM1]BCA53494.1 Alkyl hydroperoxide reductase subunit C [Nitrospira sp. KM1]
MASIGQAVPEGTYQVYHDREIRSVSLDSYRGQWLVLVFYPGDFTFICPTELEDLGKRHAEFKKLGAQIIGVSTDSVYVHKAWHDTSQAIKNIPFPLLADMGGRLAQSLGVYIHREGVALRGSFIFDPDGRLCAYEVHANNVGRDMGELLRKLQASAFVRENGSEVCPSGWKPGDRTLRPSLDLVGKI